MPSRQNSTPVADSRFGYTFPAIRGIQAGREYYISMCPLRLIPKVFLFNEEELVPELRAQRILNKARIPEIARYIADNPKDYVFSALTASIDAEVRFEPFGASGDDSRMGTLHVPMEARFIINDGQHRRAAIEKALLERPDLADETISIVFFLDIGLKRCQQMFADLNRYAIRPSRSLGVLYDHRDDRAELVRLIVLRSDFFKNIVETERSTLSPRSRKLITLSALYHATRELFDDLEFESREEAASLGQEYWEAVASHLAEWKLVREGKMSAGEVRRDYLHSHGVVLQALGIVGNSLLHAKRTALKTRLRPLGSIDWSRGNARWWEGRAMTGGRVSKGGQNVALTANAIKRHLKLSLSPEERQIERALKSGRAK